MQRLLPVNESNGLTQQDFDFPDLTTGQTWVRGSFIVSLDGAIAGTEGRSGSLSTEADRVAFPLLRRACDAILVGAGTVRAERYHPSRFPMAVVSSSMDFPAELPLIEQRGPDSAPLVFLTTNEQAAQTRLSKPGLEVVGCGTHAIDLGRALADLSSRGWHRIHCEGGAGLLGSLLEVGLLDEIVLTVSPMLIGGGPHLVGLPGFGPVALDMTQVIEVDGTVFLRAVVQH